MPSGPACVRPGELLRHDPRPPCRIHCTSGAVWVTIDGNLRDYVLTAGQCMTVRERQPTLIMGLEAAAIRIDTAAEPASQPTPLQRWWSRGPAHLVQQWRRRMQASSARRGR